MGYIGVIDCGTTNSRFNIVDRDGEVKGSLSAKVGVKDTAIRGNNEYLKGELEALYSKTLAEAGLREGDVDVVVSSGMITSELGLVELPHLVAPAGLGELASGLEKIEGKAGLRFGPELFLVRGVKNKPNPPRGSSVKAVKGLDFMRGEETQVMGLLAIYGGEIPTTVVNLSSHTKSICLDRGGRILGCATTLSGQVYESLIKETFIGKSICPPQGKDSGASSGTDAEAEALSGQMAEAEELAVELVEKSGLLRTFLVPRFMDTLMTTDWRVRKRFFEAAIAADDIKSWKLFPEYGFGRGERLFFVGVKERCELYSRMLRYSDMGGGAEIRIVCLKEEVDGLAVRGALAIAKAAGITSL